MMVARSWSLSAPVTISEALAEKPLTSTTMGLSVATGPVAVSSSLGECRPAVEVTRPVWKTPVTSTACVSRPPPL